MPHNTPEKRREYQREYQKRWRLKYGPKWAEIRKRHVAKRRRELGEEAYKRWEAEKSAAWRKANPDRMKEFLRESYLRRREKILIARRMKKYGLSDDAFQAMRKRQGNQCAICRTVFMEQRRIHVDHCHSTNRVRGLLCSTCNSGLGHFKDNEMFLTSAAKYLLASRGEG